MSEDHYNNHSNTEIQLCFLKSSCPMALYVCEWICVLVYVHVHTQTYPFSSLKQHSKFKERINAMFGHSRPKDYGGGVGWTHALQMHKKQP